MKIDYNFGEERKAAAFATTVAQDACYLGKVISTAFQHLLSKCSPTSSRHGKFIQEMCERK